MLAAGGRLLAQPANVILKGALRAPWVQVQRYETLH
jgi:hypothetical protein